MRTVGVFDSGVGGLSVLRVLSAQLPAVQWVYVADSAFAPYGDRSPGEVQDRSVGINSWLVDNHAPDLLVVACNTATAWAIEALRTAFPHLPIVGVEPALKPAALLTRTGHIGVVATSGTLASPRYAALQRSVRAERDPPLHISTQACPGLADAIERGDEAAVQALCQRYVQALLDRAPTTQPLDTLVLGCTHYPFAMAHWQAACGEGITLVDNASAIARRVASLLPPAPARSTGSPPSAVSLHASGPMQALQDAVARWMPEMAVRNCSPLSS